MTVPTNTQKMKKICSQLKFYSFKMSKCDFCNLRNQNIEKNNFFKPTIIFKSKVFPLLTYNQSLSGSFI